MKNITGTAGITLTAESGETYCITYETNCAVDINNQTEGQIYISNENDFSVENGVGKFIKLSGGTSYNGYRPYLSAPFSIYIYAEQAGDISIAVKGW